MLGLSSTQEYPERACLSKAFATLVEECGIVERREAETEPLAHLDKEPAWAQDRTAVRDFLQAPCGCGRNCTSQITEEELLNSRHDFGMLSWREKNCVVLSQLQAFQDAAPVARSARASKVRERQKFHYQLSFNRPVCRQVFLFYHGETPRRLESLQRHLRLVGTIPPMHGNTGRAPAHATTTADRDNVEVFLLNYVATHGLPDPGRDLRTGKGKLRVLLPAVMNFQSIHRVYQENAKKSSQKAVGYHTFIRIWQERLPNICFIKPRTDLCMTCENFKKALHRIASDLDEQREQEKIRVHQQAVEHLECAKKERDYYRQCSQVAATDYQGLTFRQRKMHSRPNARDMTAHYSWDFAKQLQYPYEDQQVGPIYFKTPRRAQLFGVCCEGIPKQINYLIDEADLPDKGSNTVITLLDHFFMQHGLGEKRALLTADNCVGQNKNNALLHYLLYRALVGLHDRIDLACMLVGHTKFSPDGFFGLIRRLYRRSKVYTYEQLAEVIDKSTQDGVYNICQRYRNRDSEPNYIYRDWAAWLSKYFKPLPNITKYHHFSISKEEPGVVTVKKARDAVEEKYDLLKGRFPYNPHKFPRLPRSLKPPGLSPARAWYLYEKIREHIPDHFDKDQTCPRPRARKPS